MHKKSIGRPTSYNADVCGEICLRLARGESLKSICRDAQMPDITTVYRWLFKHKEFYHQYQQARDKQVETFADEIIEIADDATNDYVEKVAKNGKKYVCLDNEHVLRSRLRIDTRKWIAERMKPKKYGLKSEVHSTSESKIEVTVKHVEIEDRLNCLLQN